VKDFIRVFNQFWQKNASRNYFILFMAVAVILIIGLMQSSIDEDTGPCSRTQYFGECYDIPRTLCETTLAITKSSCEILIKNITKPGQLSGPIQRQKNEFDLRRAYQLFRNLAEDESRFLKYAETKTNA